MATHIRQLCQGEGLHKWIHMWNRLSLDIDLRVSAFSVDVRTDGSGLGGRSTSELSIGKTTSGDADGEFKEPFSRTCRSVCTY